MSLRDLRKSRGLTQEQVARKSDMTLTTYGNYERNQTMPRLDKIEKLSDVFGVPVEVIFKAVKTK